MHPLMFATLLLPTAAPNDSRVWTKSYEVSGRPQVRVVAEDIPVHVHTRVGGPVEFRVEYDRRAVGLAIPSDPRPRVSFERTGDAITLRVLEPRTVLVVGMVNLRHSIDVTLPVASDLSVHTEDGDVTCEPLQGHQHIETSDGSIKVAGLDGVLELQTSDGAIRAENLQGRLVARTGDGDVDVEGRFDALSIRTGDGRLVVRADRGSKLAEPWDLTTADGMLDLSIPPALAATIDAHTDDGSITVDLPIPNRGRIRDREFTGELNGGGPVLRLRTGDGRLRLGLVE